MENELNLEKEVVEVATDPISGNILPVATSDKGQAIMYSDQPLEDIFSDEARPDIIKEEVIKTFLSNKPDTNLSTEDIDSLVQVALKYQKNQDGYNTKINYYKLLPESIQKSMMDEVPLEIKVKYSRSELLGSLNFATRSMLDDILQNAFMTQSFQDLDHSMKKSMEELNSDLTVGYSEYNVNMRNNINNLPKMVEKLREEGNEEAAKKIEIFLEKYNDANSLDSFREAWLNGKVKVKKFELEKFDRTIASFNLKYENSSRTIPNISQAYPILRNLLPSDVPDIKIKRFIAGFIKYTMNMDPDNIEDHAYMYYFVKNIVHANKYDTSNKDEIIYYRSVIDNIRKFIDEVIY